MNRAVLSACLGLLLFAAALGMFAVGRLHVDAAVGPYTVVVPLVARDVSTPPPATPTPVITPTQAPTSTPTPTSVPTSTPTPTAVPDGCEEDTLCVRRFSSYVASTGTLHIVGEVANLTGGDVEFVEITANFYSSSGTLLATDYTFADVGVIVAGADSPFDLLLLDPPPGIARYTLRVTDYYSPPFSDPIFGLHASVSNIYTSSTGSLHMVGIVTNNSGVTYQYVEPLVALYDAQGNVVRVDFTFTSPDTLGPGQSGTFDLLILSPVPQWTSYRMWVEAYAP